MRRPTLLLPCRRFIPTATFRLIAALAVGAVVAQPMIPLLHAQDEGGGGRRSRGGGGSWDRGGGGSFDPSGGGRGRRGGGDQNNNNNNNGGGDNSDNGGGSSSNNGGGQTPGGGTTPAGGGAAAPGAATTPGATVTPGTLGGLPMENLIGAGSTMMPQIDPAKGIVSWNGTTWNVSDNRLFRARFEKYLNASEESMADDAAYQKLIEQIMQILHPSNVNGASVDRASALLIRAATYQQDSRLSENLADAIYSALLAKKEQDRVDNAIKELQKERESLEWGLQLTMDDNPLQTGQGGNSVTAPSVTPNITTGNNNSSRNSGGGGQGGANTRQMQQQKNNEEARYTKMTPYAKRLAETEARIKINQSKTDITELQAKIQYQALVLQFFMQRRFQHVLMAGRFYRVLFDDGNSRMNVNRDAQKILTMNSGLPVTMVLLETMASQAISDVREGVEAYQFLLSKGELASATERLQETFVLGEYVSYIRKLPRDAKRRALEYSQKGNQLLSALDVKDYGRAETLLKEIEAIAKDFDSSKAMTVIETAKKVSAMHLAKAKNAAMTGDGVTMEAELKAATEIWPRNPQLEEVASGIFKKGDVVNQATIDFERLLAQKNYRQIYEDRMRFIAAMAAYPDKAKELKKVLEDMTIIEMSLVRAEELAKRNEYAGAWESVELAAEKYPDDLKLAQVRADYTTRAAEFVNCIRRAKDLEKKKQLGSSLTWYLRAKRLCPTSEFAKEGIDRVTVTLMPDEA
ncbi:hypothetical protein DB346_17935 [Verrucomicrobia bacterium LW23]|nr:hypothetical protein DB346_17935 [Verrucomicrobia bacterium LW23]